MEPILRIENLHVQYRDRDRVVNAVDGVDLSLRRGETLAVVGESGCGKTTLALSILNLLPSAGAITSGRIFYDDRDLLSMKSDDLRRVRGSEISMIFQDPVNGLNPVLTIGAQVEEIVRTHRRVSKKEARAIMLDALQKQGLAEPERISKSYAKSFVAV